MKTWDGVYRGVAAYGFTPGMREFLGAYLGFRELLGEARRIEREMSRCDSAFCCPTGRWWER